MFLRNINKLFRKFETYIKPLNLIEISRSAVLHNFDLFQNKSVATHVWPVIKSNAYGYGIKQIVEILKDRHFDYYIADSYYEVIKIWEIEKHPVLLIGSVLPENFSKLDLVNLTLTIQDFESLQALGKLLIPCKIHLKVNTGMNRQGIEPQEIPKFLELLKQYPQVELEGVFSHLADAQNSTHTKKQYQVFKSVINQIDRLGLGYKPKYFHLASTYGSPKVSDPAINALRLGLGLYGYGPYSDLKPALGFSSSITKVRSLKKGEKVGYGYTYTATKQTNIGIIPVGYYEGLDIRLSNKGYVKYQDKFYPIIGKVCMNLSFVDFGKTIPNLFDSVEIIGLNPVNRNSILNISSLCQTVPYEILVHLSESIRRTIVD